MAFLDSLGSKLQSFGESIVDEVSDLANSVVSSGREFFKSDEVKDIFNFAKDTVGTIYKDVKAGGGELLDVGKEIGSFYGSQIDKLTSLPGKVVDKVGDTVSDLGSDLSMPLTVGLGVAGLVLAALIIKK
jgi:hypothetical protein